MRAVITHDQLEVQDNTLYNSGSIDYYEIDTEFTAEWEDLTKYAIINGAEAVKIPVVANKVKVDRNTSGTYYIGFVGYTIDDDKKTYQISTNLQPIYFQIGAGELPAADPQDLPDPTTWEAYLNEIETIVNGAENVNITAEKIDDTTYITTTDKTGTATTTEITDGKDAKINGVNTLTVEGGANVTIEQEGSTLIISATDTTDYMDLSNKPSINGVELSGNKTSSDLNIKQTYNKADVGLGNVDNVRQYSVNNPPPYPVTSVNGQTGAVVIDTHDDLIPTQASSSNQLADKNFVNSTVGTATATFRGTYDSLAELEQVSADENDYGFVVDVDSAGNTVYNRYKYASGTWTFEYALNNSSFTQAQWEAIQSGITDDLVTKLQGIETGAEVNIVEGLKIGNVTQQVSNKIVEINPDTTPVENSTNVIDSNAVYEVEKLLPTDIESGESVDITNAQPYKVLDIVADGKYQQNTTTGKNMYEGSQDFTGTWGNDNQWQTDSQTYNGLVVKKRSGLWDGLYKEISVESGKTYTFSFYAKSDTARPIGVYTQGGSAVVYPSATEAENTTTSWQRYSLTFTVTTNGTIRPRVENRTGITGSYTYICGYQLEESATMTDYEPYTGGIPSPNPNYPQPITQVTSATWNRTGKQLFDKSTATDNYRIGSDGALFYDNEYCVSDFIAITSSTSYTYSRYASGGGSAAVCFYDSNKTFISRIMWNTSLSSQVQTFTTPSNTNYLRITDLKTLKDNMQIEQGSGTTYSSYQGQSIPIDLDGNEVCAILNTKKDKLLVDRYGNVALQKNINKLVLNGSEIGIRNTYTNIDYATIQKPSDFLGYNTWDTTTIICSSATYLSVTQGTWDTANNVGKISGNATEKYWWVGFTKGTAQATMQTTLNNSIIYYPLTTPTIIPLPKLSVLPTTLKGINHIWVDTNLGITQIEVEYVKDLSLDIPTKTSELTNDANFVKNTDYATSNKGGVIVTGVNGITLDNTGHLQAGISTYAQYQQKADTYFVGKGTLENVLTERIGTIETALTTLDVGGGVQ